MFKHHANLGVDYQSRLSPSYFYHYRFKTEAPYFWYTEDDVGNVSTHYIHLVRKHFLFKTGIDHGSDVFLVFSTLRNYSDAERLVIENFVEMYYNFAATSTAVFGNLTVERARPGIFKALEINSGSDYKMVQLDDEFGQIRFWNEIEEALVGSGGSRLHNLFAFTFMFLVVGVLRK